MSGAYSLFRLHPIHVHGKGEVAPEGYVSDAQREMMEAAQRGAGAKEHPSNFGGCSSDTPATTSDPWGDLR
jgi:hypothetical protein